MSTCTDVLAKASEHKLCDVVVIGVKPDASLYIDWTGTTIASLIMFLELAKEDAVKAWHTAAVERKGVE